MKRSAGFGGFLLLALLCFRSVASGIDSNEPACINWQTLLNNDDQAAIPAHLNNKRPYPDDKATVYSPRGCRLVQAIYLGRHGSRYVTKDNKLGKITEKFNKLLETEPGDDSQLTESGLALKAETERLTKSTDEFKLAGSITSKGRTELELIARRLATGAQLAPARLETDGSIVAITSSMPRTKQSLNAFMEGLKGWSWNQGLNYSLDMEGNEADKLLRSYKFCPRRSDAFKTVKNRFEKEQEQFIEQSNLSFDFIQALSHRTLSSKERFKVAEIIYNLCQLDSNHLEKDKYGFCNYFLDQSGNAREEVKLLSKLQNHKQWYKRGFGSGETVMFNLALPLLEQVVSKLSGINSSGNDTPVMHLWFSHDSVLVAMIMLLGYYGDQPEYDHWDSDLAAPMSANIQWRAYQCGEETKLQVLLNEQPVCLSDCPGAFCSLSDYLAKSRQRLNGIDFQSECGTSEHVDNSDDDD